MNKLKTILLAIALSGMVACGTDQSDAQYIAKAESYTASGDLNSAVLELKNALQQNAGNVEARYLLGAAYLAQGEFPSAEKELARALELGAAPSKALPLLGRALLGQHKLEDVIKLEIPEGLDIAASMDLTVTQGTALQFQGKQQRAETLLGAVLEQEPGLIYALEASARLQASQGDFTESRKTLEAIFKLDSDNVPAWSLLGQVEQTEGNAKAAEAAYTKAIELSNSNTDDILRRAMLRISQSDFDGAEKDIVRIEQLVKNNIGVIYARGLLQYSQQNYKAAQQSFDAILSMIDSYPPALFYAAATHMKLGNQKTAEQHLDKFVSRISNNPQANRMLAVIKLYNGHFEQAERLLTLVLEENSEDIAALSLLAQTLQSMGKGDEAVETLRELVVLQPESAPGKVALANALWQTGDSDAAVLELRAAIEMDPALATAPATLVKLYLAEGEREKAVETALTFLHTNEGSLTAHNLLGSTYMSLGDYELARASFEQVLSEDPGNISANSGLAILAVHAGNPDEARKYYEARLKSQRGHLNTLLNLATLEAATNNPEATKLALQRAIKANPEALEPRMKLGIAYLIEGRAGEVPNLMGDMLERYPNNVQLLALLADSARVTSQYNEALRLVQRLVQLKPEDAAVHYQLARIYASLGERKIYRDTLVKTIKLDAQFYAARTDYTRELLLSGEFDGADAQLEILEQQGHKNVDITIISGQLAEARGNINEALEAFQLAYNQKPNSETAIRLSNVTWKTGDKQGAVELLEAWTKEHPQDTLTHLELGNRYLALGQEVKAITMYEKVISQDTARRSPLALNNLAWLLRESHTEKALIYAEEAHKLAPESPELVDTLTIILLIRGGEDDLKRALRMNERIRLEYPDNSAFAFHAAQLHSASGNEVVAKEILVDLLNREDNFPEREAAEQALHALQ